MDESATLVREARESGFTVEQTRGGHVRYTAPTGQVVIDASTPSDHRGTKNTRARLKRIGLGQKPEGADERKEQAKERTAKAGVQVRVLDYLQARPGSDIPLAEIQDALGLSSKQAGNAIQNLKSKHSQLVHGDNGWCWTEILTQPTGTDSGHEPVEQPQLLPAEPEKSSRRYGLSLEIFELLKQGGGEELSITEMAKHFGVENRQISMALNSLQKSQPDVTSTRRAHYAYRPKEPSEKDHARAKLRLIDRDLKSGEVPAVARTLMLAERDRLQAFLDAPETPEEAALEVQTPEHPLRPITVKPTQLPDGCPSLFEAVTVTTLGDSKAIVLKDENDNLWITQPIKIQFAGVAFGTIN